MSAPTSSAPLVVNTRDGACWTRRTVTEGGIALYALADVCKCPEYVMATLAELAERGIVGSADVLPMPVAPDPQAPAEVFVPRTERSYWVAIAEALNAAHAAGMPVGVDLDGTLTDHNAWSVVWDRAGERWAVAGYEDGFPPLDEASKASFAERAERETDSGRRAAWRMLAEPEPEFHAFLRKGRVPHDLPETGGDGRG